MAFEAGAIKGRIDLDTEEFKAHMSEAHTHTETEGGRMREVFETIAESISESLGPAVGQLGMELQSVLAGFSEGPVLGSIHAIGVGVGALGEATEGAAEHFDEIGIAAQRAGVHVEWLSRLAGVGESVDLGAGDITTAFKILEQRAEEAREGTKEAVQGFQLLGISATDAASLMDDPQKLFERVQTAIQSIRDPSLRTAAALDVMGRQGSNLVPLLQMSQGEFNRTADTIQALGGQVSESDAQWGDTFKKLQTYLHAAEVGIERAFASPVLDYFQHHLDEIVSKMEKAEKWVASHGPAAAKEAVKTASDLKKDADFLGIHPVSWWHSIRDAIAPWGDDIGRTAGYRSVGYVPSEFKGSATEVPIPAQPLPPELMPHWTAAKWRTSPEPIGPAAPPPSSGASAEAQADWSKYQAAKAAYDQAEAHAETLAGQLEGIGHLFPIPTDFGASGHDLFHNMAGARDTWMEAARRANAPAPHSAATEPPSLGNMLMPLSPGLGIATDAISAVSFDSLRSLMDSLAPAIDSVTRRLHDLLTAAEEFGRVPAASRSGVLGPPAPSPPQQSGTPAPGSVSIGTINSSFDPRDTANIIANRLLPVLRDQHQQQQRQIAGAAVQAVIEQTLGGLI